MTRILFLINSLRIGGAERQFVTLVKAIGKQGFIDPTVCCFDSSDSIFADALLSSNISIVTIPRLRKIDGSLLRNLIRYVRGNRIDLIHSFSVLPGLVAVACGRLLGVPVVASTIRDSKDSDPMTYLSIRIQSLLADRFVSNTIAGFKNRFRRMKKNFRVVYNGVSLDEFRPSAQTVDHVREELNLFRFDTVVAMVASLSINKDYDTFIEAMPSVLFRRPQTGFLIVGDGTERDRLKRKVAQLGVEENVIFTGYTGNVAGILASTDVSVLMTNVRRIEEGMSNSILESLALGVPVVANRGGGTEEVVENGVNGLLVEPYDGKALSRAVLTLLEHADLRKEYGKAGVATVYEKFSSERCMNDYLSIYRELT